MRYDRKTLYHYPPPIRKLPFLDSRAKLVWAYGQARQGHRKREDPTRREKLHCTCARPWPFRGSGIPSHLAIPCGTNRVGAPKALRRMCSAQSGSLLLGLWLFSLFLYLNDDRKSSPNAVWFSAVPINKAPSDPMGGKREQKWQGLLYLPICLFSLCVLWSRQCLCSVSSGLGKWGSDLSVRPHLSTMNYLKTTTFPSVVVVNIWNSISPPDNVLHVCPCFGVFCEKLDLELNILNTSEYIANTVYLFSLSDISLSKNSIKNVFIFLLTLVFSLNFADTLTVTFCSIKRICFSLSQPV